MQKIKRHISRKYCSCLVVVACLNCKYKEAIVFYCNTCIILFLSSSVNCTGNLLVIFVILRYRRMRTVVNCFLANLALSDLLVGIFCVLPNLSAYLSPYWNLGKVKYHSTLSLYWSLGKVRVTLLSLCWNLGKVRVTTVTMLEPG